MIVRKPKTDEDLFIGELKTALRALIKAREIADAAPADTVIDEAWDAVSDLEDKTRKLLHVLGYTEISAETFAAALRRALSA